MGRIGVGAAAAIAAIAYLKYRDEQNRQLGNQGGSYKYDPTPAGTYFWLGLAGFAVGFSGAEIAKLAAKANKE